MSNTSIDKKHGWHWKKNGRPGVCQTTPELCPRGGPHFPTYEQAYAKYQERMEANGGTFSSTSKLSKSEINGLAKTAEISPELMESILEKGSNLTLRNLTKNPNVTEEALVLAYEKTDDADTATQISKHERFPKALLHGDAFLTAVEHSDNSDFGSADGITDDHIRALLDCDKRSWQVVRSMAIANAVRNPNNKLSDEVRALAAEKSGGSALSAAAESGKYPLGRIANLSAQQISWFRHGASRAKNDAAIIEVARWSVGNNGSSESDAIASGADTPPEALRILGEGRQSIFYVVGNPNTPKDVVDSLSREYPEAASLVKVKKLDKEFGSLESRLTVGSEHRGNNRGWNEYTFTLDKKFIAEHDLSETDIKNAFGFYGGKFNGGFRYDETTGVITAAVDSSG